METVDNKLCATYDDLREIMSYEALKKHVQRGRAEKLQRGGNGNVALYVVDSLPTKYRLEVYRRHPDYKVAEEAKPIMEMIVPDAAAEQYYMDYKLPDGRNLPTEKQTEYASNAAILNAFGDRLARADSQRIKQSDPLFNRAEFWGKAAAALPYISDRWPNTLPQNARRLQEKYNEYKKIGYISMITNKYGSRNAAKVDDDTKESLVVELLADPRNLDNAQIAGLYNVVGKELGWKPITPATVAIYRKKHDLITSGRRLGETRFRNKKTMQVKRSRPNLPLLYWTLDGWTAELLYQKTEINKKTGYQTTTYSNRLTLVLVLDTCLNYPIGYAIGERETPELIKAALRNAANHTADLFGHRYRTNQLQSDNYGRGNLKPAYEVMGKLYTPARAHNAKAKVIEPYFNQFNKKYCQLCPNWAGFGITSNKDLQPNSEFLNKNRHSFPTREECQAQLASFVERERAEKRAQYVALFADLPHERRLPLSTEQYLLCFGSETGYDNTLEASGLRPRIGGIKRDYDCFDAKFRQYPHVKWTVKYDPDDLSQALAVSKDGTLRFMLESKHVQPMAISEQTAQDREQLGRVRGYNKNLERDLSERLALSGKNVEQLFADNPQLDVPTRLLICDSRGQNKNHKSTRRIPERHIEYVESVDVAIVEKPENKPTPEPENIYNMY